MAESKAPMDLDCTGEGSHTKPRKCNRTRKPKQKQDQSGGHGSTEDPMQEAGQHTVAPKMCYTAFKDQHSGRRHKSAPNQEYQAQGGQSPVPPQVQGQPHRGPRGQGSPQHIRSQGWQQNSPAHWQHQQQMMGQQPFYNPNMMQSYPQPYPQSHGPYNMPQSQGQMHGQGWMPQDFQGQRPRTPQNKKQGSQNRDSYQQSPQGDSGKQKRTPKLQKLQFEDYWSTEDVQRGLKRGELIEGPVRINPKNFEDSYVPHPDGKSDIYICGMKNRNRALNGDVVALLLEPRDKWKVLVDDVDSARDTKLAKKMKNLALSNHGVESEEKHKAGAESSSETDVIIEEEYVVENDGTNDPPATRGDIVDDTATIACDPNKTTKDSEIMTDDASAKEVNPEMTTQDPEAKTETKDPDIVIDDPVSKKEDPEITKNDPEACSSSDSVSEGSVGPVVAVKQITSDSQNAEKETAVIVSSQTTCGSTVGVDSDLKVDGSRDDSSSSTNVHSNQNRPASTEQACKKPPKKNKNKSPVKGQAQLKEDGSQQQTGGAATPQKQRYTSLADFVGAKTEGDSGAGGSGTRTVPDNMLLRTAKVVYISEKKHSRACTGHIKLQKDRNPNHALFSPLDSRLPRILVPVTDCPQGFYERPEDHAKTLFIARITQWSETSIHAKGEMARSLGEAGEIEPETEGILIEHDIDFNEFSDEAIACLPTNLPWNIPQEELSRRRDLRRECIFTIDPASARDLDDALSCKPLGNGRYEVGVHIADVSYFVQPENALDDVAASRATSVYMVQKVVPMLPRLLCEQLCSLNPNQDRLTFSVIWTITEQGEIEEEWFGRSVIRSCVKMSYNHAQGMIEDPQREWSVEELPPISEGFTIPQIKDIVLLLNKIAQNMRKKRYENGALRLDQVKLQYTLDKETGLPCGYSVYKQRESNKLVEEFMLLANMAVARQIYSHYHETAVLRRHPPPQTRMIDELSSMCRQLGIPLDVTDSRTIQQSLAAFSTDSMDDQAKLQILTVLCSKPMQNARYFCTGVIDDEEDYRHYALNVPFYTHFTSPIRRYPDIMVHRLLAASLKYCDAPRASKGEIQKQSEHCNDKKTAAKGASDRSTEIFFAVFVKECGPLEEHGMVMAVLDKAFDVLILELGVVKRVYCERLPLAKYSYRRDKKAPLLTLVWKADDAHPKEVTQIISIFSRVSCQLSADEQPLKWSAIVKHPSDVEA